MSWAWLTAALLASAPKTVSEIPCQTVDDCWLDTNGKPIARPKSKKGHPIPRGNCGGQLVWLRNQLACEQAVCTVQFVGDKC